MWRAACASMLEQVRGVCVFDMSLPTRGFTSEPHGGYTPHKCAHMFCAGMSTQGERSQVSAQGLDMAPPLAALIVLLLQLLVVGLHFRHIGEHLRELLLEAGLQPQQVGAARCQLKQHSRRAPQRHASKPCCMQEYWQVGILLPVWERVTANNKGCFVAV